MKKVLLLSLLVILFSSCRVPDSVMAGYKENPFLDRVRVETDNCDIVFFTDSHIGRDRNRSDIKHFDKKFLSFLDEGGDKVVISGGDMADDGEMTEELTSFIETLVEKSALYL